MITAAYGHGFNHLMHVTAVTVVSTPWIIRGLQALGLTGFAAGNSNPTILNSRVDNHFQPDEAAGRCAAYAD